MHPSVRAPGAYVVDVDAQVGATSAGEASVAVNPANPQQIAITRFTFPWNNDADLVYSTDGGVTWTDEATIPPPPGVANTAGGPNDQTIDFGRDGTLYGTFLTGGNQIVTGSTTDPTKAASWKWNNPTPTTTQLTSASGTNADQPWLVVNRDPGTASKDDVYVGYQDFRTNVPHDHVAVSPGSASPVDITRDHPAGTGALSGGVINGGLRVAADRRNGTVYALYQQGGGGTQPENVTLMLNRSTDAGASWTLGGSTDGIAVSTDDTRQGNGGYSFGNVNFLQGGIDHLAVDPTNGDVYVAYGADASGNNRIRIRRLTDNGAGGMNVGAAVNVSASTDTALPSVAVLDDGTIGVLYLSNDGTNASGFPEFSAHLARSTDHGATFTDTVLQSFTTTAGNAQHPSLRLFGDYEQLKALGNTFYGAFIGNLNGLNQTVAQPTDAVFFAVPQTTKSTLGSSADPSVFGQPVAFTASVVPPPDGGTVTFKVDGTQLGGPVAVDSATGTATSAAIATLAPGPHTVAAVYGGDPNYVGDTAMTLTQDVGKAPVTTTLASAPDPSVFGQPVTVTDTVCPTGASTNATVPPAGTVTLSDGTTVLGTPTLSPGGGAGCARAQLSTAALAVGPHSITADYAGDTDYTGAATETLVPAQQVNRAPVSTTLVSSANPSSFGHAVTFTDTVCPASPSTGPTAPPTGTVSVSDGSTLLGTGTLSPGGGANCAQAQVAFAHLLPGSHTVTARYGGDGDYLPGAPESITQTVACARTITGTTGGLFTGGESTCIVGATVNGSVRDAGDGALFISGSTIHGAVLSTDGTLFGLCGSTVTSTVNVHGATGFVVVGDPGDDGCAGNRIDGSLMLSGNQAGLEAVGNHVGGEVQVQGTTGAGPFPEDTRAELEGNTIGGSLSCTDNTPPPGDDGHPNTVSGQRLGQCSAL
ncbi:hypothetical protein GCM10009738_57550 [Kitasatospora viridis]